MKTINDIAREIYEGEFGCDDSIASFTAISLWFECNIGKLNVLTYSCFEEVDPELDNEAADIFKCIYLHQFYQKSSAKALRGILDGSAGSIISIKEGDTTIIKSNKNEVAKTLRGLANDMKAQLDDLVGKYHSRKSPPLDVQHEDC